MTLFRQWFFLILRTCTSQGYKIIRLELVYLDVIYQFKIYLVYQCRLKWRHIWKLIFCQVFTFIKRFPHASIYFPNITVYLYSVSSDVPPHFLDLTEIILSFLCSSEQSTIVITKKMALPVQRKWQELSPLHENMISYEFNKQKYTNTLGVLYRKIWVFWKP